MFHHKQLREFVLYCLSNNLNWKEEIPKWCPPSIFPWSSLSNWKLAQKVKQVSATNWVPEMKPSYSEVSLQITRYIYIVTLI